MTQQQLADSAPGNELFPRYGEEIHRMYVAETEGLTDEQLDFESDKWGWSEWSIRRNASHVASAVFRWLLGRWADSELARGLDLPEDAEAIAQSSERWLDEAKYRSMDSILNKMRDGIEVGRGVLAKETVGSMRSKELAWNNNPQAKLMRMAHPRGAREDASDPDKSWIDLEYTFRHMYYELVTHLFNIQRLKRAQGLSAKVTLPNEGYWTLADWDRSEP